MSSNEVKIENFCNQNKFHPKLTPAYVKLILELFDDFLSYSNIVHKMDRTSDNFQILSKYHSEALKDKTYEKMFKEAVEKEKVIRRAIDMDQPEIFLFKRL